MENFAKICIFITDKKTITVLKLRGFGCSFMIFLPKKASFGQVFIHFFDLFKF